MAFELASGKDYRPDVDGLRAVSVLGVILFHAGLGFPGGYVGVDVFFVISGFLITKIIQNSIEAESFTFSGFWARRVRRILPASFAVTLFTLGAGAVLLLPYDFHELGEASFSHGVFLSNVYHWLQLKDYFAREADLRPLLHTWSLAVEEHFYFLYPFLLVSLRNARKQTRVIILAVVASSSFVLSEFGTRWFPQAGFFLLPTRAWELLAGALIALWGKPSSLNRAMGQILSCCGLGCIFAAMFLYSGQTPFPGIAALLPVTGAGLVIIGNDSPGNWTCRMLSFRPIVFTGLISYSLYLWHWPLLVYAKYIAGSTLPPWMLPGILGTTVILSILTWRFVELPFRQAGVNWRPAKVIALGASVTILSCALSLLIRQSGGLPVRFAGQKLETEDAEFGNSSYFRGDARSVPFDLPIIGVAGADTPPRVVLWGDSHAPPVADALDGLLKQVGIRGIVAARSSSAPIIESGGADSEASRWNNAVLSYLEENGISDVIIVSRWASWLQVDPLFESVKERLGRLNRAGVNIYVMKQVPEQSFHVSRAIHNARFGMPIPVGCTILEHANRQSIANAYLERLESLGIYVLDPTPFCFDISGVAIVGEKCRSYYRDDDHLSSFGAVTLLGPLLRELVDDIANHISE